MVRINEVVTGKKLVVHCVFFPALQADNNEKQEKLDLCVAAACSTLIGLLYEFSISM